MKTRLGALARKGFEPNSLAGFSFGFACIFVATIVRWLLGMWFGATLYFVAFFPAVILASLFAGFWPGVASLALSVAIGLVFFVPANFSTLPSQFYANLAVYIAAGFCTVWLGHMFRSAVRELQAEQAQRELIFKEIEHRTRNMGALGAAIVQLSLKDNREAADLINRRMLALQATNDLITRAPGLEPDIGSIIRNELAPFDASRCEVHGGLLPLPPDIARSVGLIVHELVTNAVKYGALSNEGGRIRISWTRTGDTLELHWTETGGSHNGAPTRVGFGTQLIDATAKGLNGGAVREFDERSYSCRLTLRY